MDQILSYLYIYIDTRDMSNIDDTIRIKGSIEDLPLNIDQSVDYWRSVRQRYYPSIPVVITVKGSEKLVLKKNKLVVPPDATFRSLTTTICKLCTGINYNLPFFFTVNDTVIEPNELIKNIYRLYGSDNDFIHVSLYQEPNDSNVPPASATGSDVASASAPSTS
jgi:hypothetical protein